MKFFVLTAVLAACAVSSLGTAVGSPESRECCYCQGGSCGDGTPCTPFCGVYTCNPFGCNCGGGCRHGLETIQSKMQSLESSKSNLESSESSDFFDITDTNKDGVMTIVEWLDSPVRSSPSGETCSMLVKQWAKYDPANVGYLTKHQAINRQG